jgi:hypothetical protein
MAAMAALREIKACGVDADYEAVMTVVFAAYAVRTAQPVAGSAVVTLRALHDDVCSDDVDPGVWAILFEAGAVVEDLRGSPR